MARTPQITPADLLEPGMRDARRLLRLWTVRRSAIPVFWLGLIVGILISPTNEVHVSYETPEDAFRELATPAAGIMIAILIRLGTTFAGVLLALPLALAFDAAGRGPGYSGRKLDRVFDQFGAARGYGSLRFTRYVRDAAVQRLGAAGAVYDRLDRGIRVATYALPALTPAALLAL